MLNEKGVIGMKLARACLGALQLAAVAQSFVVQPRHHLSTMDLSPQTERLLSMKAVPGADIEQEMSESSAEMVGDSIVYRGKLNEIDFCIAPADVSLSRAYNQNSKDRRNPIPKTLSLTQALNNASNRAVRRILLARCWPSPESLNKSLRLVAKAEKEALEKRQAEGKVSGKRCPVPRPILNIITGKGNEGAKNAAMVRIRSDEEYVADQIKSFREKYGTLPGYAFAEAYLDSILSIATTGVESDRVKEVCCSFYLM